MNSPSSLLTELSRRGVKLWAEGERLRYRAPRGAMTPELVGALRAHKAALLGVLRDAPRGPCYACGHRDWWRRPGGPWTCAVCHPPAVAPVERVTGPEPAATRAAGETATPTASGRSPPDPLSPKDRGIGAVVKTAPATRGVAFPAGTAPSLLAQSSERRRLA